MIPLNLCDVGVTLLIKRIGGKEKQKTFLESLGFVSGAEVTIVNKMGENVIVNIKDSRVAISKELGGKIWCM